MKGVRNLPDEDQNNETQNYKAVLEAERMKLQNEQLQKDLDKQKEEHTAYVAKQDALAKVALVKQVMEAEIELKKLKTEDQAKRIPDLEKESTDYLNARLVALKEHIDLLPDKPQPLGRGLKSKVFGAPGETPQMTEQLSGRQVREMQLEWLGKQMFGENYQPSNKAVGTLDDWDMPKGEWKFPLKELIA